MTGQEQPHGVLGAVLASLFPWLYPEPDPSEILVLGPCPSSTEPEAGT